MAICLGVEGVPREAGLCRQKAEYPGCHPATTTASGGAGNLKFYDARVDTGQV